MLSTPAVRQLLFIEEINAFNTCLTAGVESINLSRMPPPQAGIRRGRKLFSHERK